MDPGNKCRDDDARRLHMSVVLGSGEHRYRVVENWAKLPDKWEFMDVGAVAVDSKDQVYVFNRGEHPMMVFDREGNFLRSWGEGVFNRAHGLHIGPDEALYCTDDGDHSVRKCTLDGKVLLTIGIPGKPAPYMSGEPFHRCTHTALSPRGDIYVSDGYGNSSVHKYSPDGKRIKSWGTPGTGPGQFNIPHNLCCDPDGWVYVADRENHRVQVFDGNGKYETEWHNLHRPCGMVMEVKKKPLCYIGEIGPTMPVNREVPNLGPRISIVDREGNLVSRFGAAHAGYDRPDEFVAPHGMAVDSHGDIYVGEVSYTAWSQIYPDRAVPPGLRTLRKLVHMR
jgi:DNA-binding beta-propeller fold protein YncE